MRFIKHTLKDPQNVIAIAVSIISLCALGVSYMQTKIMQEEHELVREYSRASVWPHIELPTARGFNEDGTINTFAIALVNNGVGPAIITDVKVTYKGQVANNWWQLFDILEIPDSIGKAITNRPFNGKVIKIGDFFHIINLNHNLPLAEAFNKKSKEVLYEIYYESVYKEKWKYDGKETIKLENFEGLPEEKQFN